ncbi:hypothetical protein [Methylobacter sp. sgz302048]|uniref:hypothetical protein n=1 Tax=Methylobacter sp. sgz302048 TaxID=3455945 RepID=UPI003F9F8B1D
MNTQDHIPSRAEFLAMKQQGYSEQDFIRMFQKLKFNPIDTLNLNQCFISYWYTPTEQSQA